MQFQSAKETNAYHALLLGTGKPHRVANDGGSWRRNWVARTLRNKGEDLVSEQVDVSSGGEVDATVDGNGNNPTASCVGYSVIPEQCQGFCVPIKQDWRVIFGRGHLDNVFGQNIISLSEMSNRHWASLDLVPALLPLLLLRRDIFLSLFSALITNGVIIFTFLVEGFLGCFHRRYFRSDVWKMKLCLAAERGPRTKDCA